MPHILQGSIVRARVSDPQGGNPKVRPLVVVTRNSEISQSGVFVGAAITKQVGEPLNDEVPLQWHPRRKCRTRLITASVAKCSWLCALQVSDVVEVKGHVPAAELDAILTIIERLAVAQDSIDGTNPPAK